MEPRTDAPTYDEFAPYYDLWADLANTTSDDVAFYRGLAADHLGSRCVELGVGTGRVIAALVDDGADVIGVDASAAMLQRAHERLRAPARGRFELIQADFVDWRTDDDSIGLVYSPYHTLPHLLRWEDWRRLFENVHRYLAPGGQFAFSVAVPRLGDLAETAWQEKGRFALEGGEAIVSTRVNRRWSARRSTTEVRGQLMIDGREHLRSEWTFELRLVRPDEIRDLAQDSGFDVEDVSDSYLRRGEQPVSEQVWILAKAH